MAIKLNRDLLNVAKNLPVTHGWEAYDNILPNQDGFVFLGAGVERTVWLGPDGMVYKIDDDGNANWNEWRHATKYRRSTDLPCWIYIPEVAYDSRTGIAVCEYVRGNEPPACWEECMCQYDPCYYGVMMDAFDYCNLGDGHEGNCRVVEGNSPSDYVIAILDLTR